MNNRQLLNRCSSLFEALDSLSKKESVLDEYKEAYKLFYESVTILTKRYSDILDGFIIPYKDNPGIIEKWEHKWHFIYNVVNAELSMQGVTNYLGFEVVFQNIKETIIANLLQANSDIIIAMAWLTDNDIMKVLIDQVYKGINVEIIISDSEENFVNYSYLGLFKNKGTIVWVSKTKEDSMMHNKFCVIDKINVLTGSYNWTYKACHNLENLLIVRNNVILAEEYLKKFEQIKKLPETIQLENYLNQSIVILGD